MQSQGTERMWEGQLPSWQLLLGKNPPSCLPLVLLPLLGRVGSAARSQGPGPLHHPGCPVEAMTTSLGAPPTPRPAPSWRALHRETEAEGPATSLCHGPLHGSCSITYPAFCLNGSPSSSPTQGLTPSQCTVFDGRAGGHPGPSSPTILSPGVLCPAPQTARVSLRLCTLMECQLPEGRPR